MTKRFYSQICRIRLVIKNLFLGMHVIDLMMKPLLDRNLSKTVLASIYTTHFSRTDMCDRHEIIK